MNRIVYPLKIQMSGTAVADLHAALQVLLANKSLLADDSYTSDKFSSELKTEALQEYYDGITAKLIVIFQKENKLTLSDEVDEEVSTVLNKMLADLGLFEPEPTVGYKLVVRETVTCWI